MKENVILLLAGLSIASQNAQVAKEIPGPDAEKLWYHISQESPYTEWGFWDEHQGVQAGNASHGPLHKVFVNTKAKESKGPAANYGAILVEENLDASRNLQALTVMYRIEGYNPEAGDWFWAKYTPDGQVDTAGKVNGCISCHVSVKDNDYVHVHHFE